MEQPKYSKVFVSHATEDQKLAEAWQQLLHTISNGDEFPWFSSDPRAKGGMQPGDWREQIHNAIDHARTILILITPASNDRSWPTWETGVAYGAMKKIVPVYLFMEIEHIHDVFRRFEAYDGLNDEVVLGLCEMILFQDRAVPESAREGWRHHYEKYEKTVLHEEKQFLHPGALHRHVSHLPHSKEARGHLGCRLVSLHKGRQ